MCIRLNSIEECPKVVESDMITYKVLEVSVDGTTGKKSYYSPISSNRLQYNIGELYTELIGKVKVIGEPSADTTTGLYSYKSERTALSILRLLSDVYNRDYELFRCKVPKGSEYYDSDEDGDTEMVSDNLVILNQVN